MTEPRARRRSQWVLILLFAVTSACAMLTGMVLFAWYLFDEKVDVQEVYLDLPFDEEQVARGRYLFMLSCAFCHLDKENRLGSHPIRIAPDWIGDTWVPNISRDPLFGISFLSDGELWTMLRSNITRDHRMQPVPVPPIRLNDDDLRAVITFLRYDDIYARAVSKPSTPSEYTVVGKIVSALYTASRDAALDLNRRAPRSRGEYLAFAALTCLTCHSPGRYFLDEEDWYRGGRYKFRSGSGVMLDSPALIGPKSVLPYYDLESFAALLRTGRTPDGRLVEMPLSPALNDDDMFELWDYFQQLGEREEYRAGAKAGKEIPLPILPRVVRYNDCDACHAGDQPTGTPEFALAHATPPDQKPLYYRLRSATFSADEVW